MSLEPPGDGSEAKRSDLLERVLAADPLLGAVIPHMLAMRHRARFSAAQIRHLLESPARPAPDAPQARARACLFQPLLESTEVAVVEIAISREGYASEDS